MKYEICYHSEINGKCFFYSNDRNELKKRLSQLRKCESIEIIYYID